jgi:hypothetical protein
VRFEVDDETRPQVDREDLKENLNNDNRTPNTHKNYGKVPKYLQGYKKDADLLAKQRAELQEKKKMPPGTRLVPEEERVKTLEDLIETKRELNQLLAQMPISMRSEGLQKRKREVEDRLDTVEKGIVIFSR